MFEKSPIKLRSGYPSLPLTLSQFALKVEAYLKDLQGACPQLFEGLRLLADTEENCVHVPADMDGFHRVIQHWAWNRDAAWVFEPMNPEDESPLPKSTHPLGYSIWFFAGGNEAGIGAKIVIRAGSSPPGQDSVFVQFPVGVGERNLDLARRTL